MIIEEMPKNAAASNCLVVLGNITGVVDSRQKELRELLLTSLFKVPMKRKLFLCSYKICTLTYTILKF